ncbi:HU family DNA-binding protein [Deinococcus sp. UYEF24]
MARATKHVSADPPVSITSVPNDAPEKLGKTQLVARVAELSHLSSQDATTVVTAALEVIIDALKAGQSVGLPGLGTLSVKATVARTGVKPGTAEKIEIPAGRKVNFKIASDLKQALKD